MESSYSDGSVREATVDFVAADVPSIGYKTYYLSPTPPGGSGDGAIKDSVVENRFYRIKLGERGIASLIDKESGEEVFDTRKVPGQ